MSPAPRPVRLVTPLALLAACAWPTSLMLQGHVTQEAVPATRTLQPDVARQPGIIPPESVIWWRFDPTALSMGGAAAPGPGDGGAPPPGGGSRLASALLRAAVASRIVDAGPLARALEGALAAGEAGAIPHTLAVLELAEVAAPQRATGAGGRDRGATAPPSIRMRAVLDLETGSGHVGLVRTLEALLVDPAVPPAQRGAQRLFTIAAPRGRAGLPEDARPAERTVASFRGPDWPDSLEVSWCSTPGHFTVAVGAGAMERWFAVQDAPLPPAGAPGPGALPAAEADAHRRFMAALRHAPAEPAGNEAEGRGPSGRDRAEALEFFMDCNALRRSMEASYTSSLKPETEGHGARLLRAWGLSNARSFMLHARVIPPSEVIVASGPEDLAAIIGPGASRVVYAGPPLLVMDATWSSRSGAPGEIARRAVSQPFWPGRDLGEPPAAAFLMVFPSDLPTLLDVSTGFYAGLVPPREGRTQDRDREVWRLRMQHIIQRQRRRLGKWIVLAGPEKPGGSLLADLALVCPLDAAADPRQFDTELLTLLTPFQKSIQAPSGGGLRTLSADSLGALNVAAWTTVRGDTTHPAVFVAALGLGLTPDAARDRVNRLAATLAPAARRAP